MTLITPDTDSARTQELLETFLARIRDLRIVIDGLTQRVANGEDIDVAMAQKLLSPAEGLVKTCLKLEASFAEQKTRERGIAQGGYAINMDQARFEIGCRLARLRACCASG